SVLLVLVLLFGRYAGSTLTARGPGVKSAPELSHSEDDRGGTEKVEADGQSIQCLKHRGIIAWIVNEHWRLLPAACRLPPAGGKNPDPPSGAATRGAGGHSPRSSLSH